MQNGSFENMCKEKYCNDSVIIGRYIAENLLEKVLDNLDIKPYEFCQMMNYEVGICDYYWAHYEKVNNLESFLNCLNAHSEQ